MWSGSVRLIVRRFCAASRSLISSRCAWTELLFRVGGLALVRLARVFERAVVDAVLPGGGRRRRPRGAPDRPGRWPAVPPWACRWPACRTRRPPQPPGGAARRGGSTMSTMATGTPASSIALASSTRASISTGLSVSSGCSWSTMRAGAWSSKMSWPLRSLNRTVFWPTGLSSIGCGEVGVQGRTVGRWCLAGYRDAPHIAAPVRRLSNMCSTWIWRVGQHALMFSTERGRVSRTEAVGAVSARRHRSGG